MKAHNATQQTKGRRLAFGVATLLLALGAQATTTAADAPAVQHSSPTVQTTQRASVLDLPLGSMYNVVDQIGARQAWEQGFTGEGINVALIDTGFSPGRTPAK